MNVENCIMTIHGGFQAIPHVETRKISITFAVDDIKSEVARLRDLNIHLVGDIEETPVHWFQAVLDPSGNMVEIGQYKKLD